MTDLGLTKRIKQVSEQLDLPCLIPYIDPKKFVNNKTYPLNEKSDVYSIGVLLWEISSGQPPFNDESYDTDLTMQILQGYRETIVPGTHTDYSDLYTGK